MKKRVLSVLLVIVLALSCCTPAFAQTYTDLNNHWAKTDMENLVNRGFLSGYSDNTMKPNKDITSCELLVMLSRFYTLTDIQKEMVKADYKSIVAHNVPTSLSWANDSIEVCLAAGIITESELKALDLNAEIEKQQLSVFLVRAMQLTNAAESLKDKELPNSDKDKAKDKDLPYSDKDKAKDKDLPYNDKDQIAENCKASIAKLAELEIVKGDTKNNFSPKSKVTRAVVSAMLSRSISYLEKNQIKLAMKTYEGLVQEKGILVSASNNNVKMRGFDGLIKEYSVPAEALVSVNGEKKALTSACEGCYADVILKNGILNRLSVEKDSSVTWVQGAIDSINASNSSLYVKDTSTGKSTNYSIHSKATILQEGKSILLPTLSYKNFVTLKISNNTVTELYSMPGNFELNGTISEIVYGASVALKVSDDKGVKYCFSLDISNLPSIKRGDLDISVDRLKVGNGVTISIKNSGITSILAKGSENKLTGRLSSVTTTATGTVWAITGNDGFNKTLVLDEGVAVYSGKTAILLSDIRIGDEVSVVIYGDTVTEVYLQTALSSSNKVSGRVLTTEKNKVTILTSAEKLVYVDTSSATIVEASTGRSLSVSSIQKNAVIVSYGTYKNSSDFIAKSVIIE